MKFKNPFRRLQFRRTRWRLSSRLLGAELAVIFVAWVAYVLFGVAIVSFIYHKGLFTPLQTAAENPSMVAHYVERADQLVLTLLAAGLFVIALQTTILRLWERARGRARTLPISSRARPIVSGRRYVILALLATVVGCSLSLGILAASNRLFVHRLAVWKELDKPSVQDLRLPALDERQVINLGWAHHPDLGPLSSYMYRSMEKPAGTYRIGFFGDSQTEGEETGPGHDYPSFLQEQLKETGEGKFEVINFGVRGYGMQQAFLIYEYLGRRYDLDAAIFMPFLWWDERDNTFMLHGYGPAIHARYVLAGDGFRLVAIDEATRRQAIENYYSLLPPAKYWRYDAHSANLVTTFARSGDLPRLNPFYYELWRGYAAELPQLYSMMFAKAAKQTKKVMVVGNDSLIESLGNSDDRGVAVLKSRLNTNSFLLLAPEAHLSALGNQMRAAEISEWITGQKLPLRVPTISDSDYRPTGEEEILSRISLTEVSDAWIEIEGRPVAGLFMHAPGDPSWRFSNKVDLGQLGIRGIIQLRGGEQLQQPVFVPADFPVQDGAPLEVRISSAGAITTMPIGTVDCVANSLCRIRFATASDVGQVRIERDGWQLEFNGYRDVSVRNGYFDGMDILVSGRPILRGQRQIRFTDLVRRLVLGRSPKLFINKFELKPLIADYLFLRAEAGHYVNPMTMRSSGPIRFGLRRKDGTVLRLGSFLQYAIP